MTPEYSTETFKDKNLEKKRIPISYNHNCQPRQSYPANLSFEIEKLKKFHDMWEMEVNGKAVGR